MRAAELKNNIVINYAEVGGFDGSRFVDPKDSVVGSAYDPATGEFANPPPPPPVIPPRHITKLAFRNRFTTAEKVAIDLAATDDPAASMALRQQAAGVRVYIDDLAAATYVDLDRPDTRAGVQQLESVGKIATGRALEILDAEIQPEERPL